MSEPTYAQTVTRLAREWRAASVNGGEPSKQVAARTFAQLEDAAERVGIL